MTKPTTASGTKLLILVGDGASPEVFTEPCGLTTKSLDSQAETSDTIVPDCADPDAPAWKERAVTALSRDFSGSGVLAKESVKMWDDWYKSGLSKNCKVQVPGTGWLTWTGKYLLTNFKITGERGTKVQVEVSMSSDGEIVSSVNT